MKTEVYEVKGMSCASCSAAVERVTRKLNGVSESSVNLTTGKLIISYDEKLVTPEMIIAKVDKAGFEAAPFAPKSNKSERRKPEANDVDRRELVGIIAAAAFSFLLLYVAMGPMLISGLPLPKFMSMDGNPVGYALTQLLLCIPVMFIGRRFFVSGTKALWHRSPNMDSLVALGSGCSFIYSVVILYAMTMNPEHEHHLYFESAAMVITLVMLGKHLEARSTRKTTAAIRKLIELAPDVATVVKPDGSYEQIKADRLNIGDTIIIKAGERVPTDCEVVSGTGETDESMLTGESMPVSKFVGSTLIGGSMNINGTLNARVTRTGLDTTLSKIVKIVEEAQGKKAPISKAADRVAGVFVPIVLVIAFVAGAAWLIAGKELSFALRVFTSVLVIACPCAMGLATPTAVAVGTGLGASHGILIRSGEALELAHKVKAVILDKTGTVTEGKPQVTECIGVNMDGKELLALAAKIERGSSHPIAAAVEQSAKSEGVSCEREVSELVNLPGRGVSARMADGATLQLGNERLMSDSNVDISPVNEKVRAMRNKGMTLLYVAQSGKLIGLIAVADRPKEGAKEAIAEFANMGVRVIMLTGDNEAAAKYTADLVGIDETIAEVLPEDKAEVVKRIQKECGTVMMVGDGINDAPALTTADVGCAIGGGSDIAIESADIVLMKDRLADAVSAVKLSRATIRNIKQNLFWAFAYNTIGIPIAAGVLFPFTGLLLSPMIAGLAMSLSSVCVVTNALRLRKAKID